MMNAYTRCKPLSMHQATEYSDGVQVLKKVGHYLSMTSCSMELFERAGQTCSAHHQFTI